MNTFIKDQKIIQKIIQKSLACSPLNCLAFQQLDYSQLIVGADRFSPFRTMSAFNSMFGRLGYQHSINVVAFSQILPLIDCLIDCRT